MLVLERLNTETRNETIVNWYKEIFPIAAAYIKKKGGGLEEAKEIFQEAVVIYYEKLLTAENKLELEDGAYLMGIVKKRWLKYKQKRSRTEPLKNLDVHDSKVKRPLTAKLLDYLHQAGEKCMDLLQSFYYEKHTMKQLAERYGYASERSATVQKFKCLERVRNAVKEKRMSYEDFLD